MDANVPLRYRYTYFTFATRSAGRGLRGVEV